MKSNLFIVICLLILLFSCAEEGPFKMGIIECNVKKSLVTPTTATITVDIPHNIQNLLKDNYGFRLSKQSYKNPESVSYYDLIHGYSVEDASQNEGELTLLFQNLDPNTTYHVVVETNVGYNGYNHSGYREYYYTEYSFTTPSTLGDIEDQQDPMENFKIDFFGYKSLESLFSDYDNFNYNVRVRIPSGTRFIDGSSVSIRLSENSDMTDKIKPVRWYLNGTEFEFRNLESKKYYIELSGDICFENFPEIIKNIEIKDSIDFSSNPFSTICEFVGNAEYVTYDGYHDGHIEKPTNITVMKTRIPDGCSIQERSLHLGGSYFSMVAYDSNKEDTFIDGELVSYYNQNKILFGFKEHDYSDKSFVLIVKELQYDSMTLNNVIIPIENNIDFSNLNDKKFLLFDDMSCKLMDFYDTDIEGRKSTSIKVELPEFSCFSSSLVATLYASESPDMANPIMSTSCDRYTDCFYFPRLEKKTYYFEFRGNLIYHLGYYIYVVIRFKEGIDLSKV